MINFPVVDINNMVENIMDGIEYIPSELDLLNKQVADLVVVRLITIQ